MRWVGAAIAVVLVGALAAVVVSTRPWVAPTAGAELDEDEDEEVETTLERIAGGNRFATSASLAEAAFPGGADVAFVATGEGFADALAGGPAAARRDAPLLLTARGSLPSSTAAELERLAPDQIVVLGGESAVTSDVEDELAGYAADVERWAGAERFATAATVAARTHGDGAEEVWLATGHDFADALAGGAAAAAADAPVLLVGRETLPAATAQALAELAPDELVVLGGQGAVSSDVAEAAAGAAGVATSAVTRLAGSERAATAAAIAEHAFGGEALDAVYVATGADFADALAGVPAAAGEGAPMLLVVGSGEVARGAVDSLAPARAVLVGGSHVLDERALSSDPRDHHFLLTDRLDEVLDRYALPERFGYALVDHEGRLIHERGGEQALLPASTQKLVSAAAALERLGGEHRLSTEVVATGAVDGAVLDGDLVVVGGGDPVLGDQRWGEVAERRPRTPLESLAAQVAEAGVREVRGDVIGYAGVLPWQPEAPGWPPRYLEDDDTTRSSGLTVNGGFRLWEEGGRTRLEAAISPARQTATTLRAELVNAGVHVVGEPGVTDQAPDGGRRLAAANSPPVGELLAHAVTWSDNHIADTLWRMVGAVDGDGTWEDGGQAATDVLADLGIDLAGARLVDGSGLSRTNRLTARQLAELDVAMAEAYGSDWDDLKAVAGRTGTLRNRLEGTVAAGSLRAKTGWLRDVRSLAGSVHGPNGRWHVAVLGNGLDRASSRVVRDVSDELAIVLTRHTHGCALDGC